MCIEKRLQEKLKIDGNPRESVPDLDLCGGLVPPFGIWSRLSEATTVAKMKEILKDVSTDARLYTNQYLLKSLSFGEAVDLLTDRAGYLNALASKRAKFDQAKTEAQEKADKLHRTLLELVDDPRKARSRPFLAWLGSFLASIWPYFLLSALAFKLARVNYFAEKKEG